MSGYRFCRSDDVPLLVDAYNRCFRPHFPGKPELTVDAFKRLVRGIDLWTSSCMVAFAGDEPVGVLLAGKREHQNLVYRIGIHPDHVGEEHGSHLLTSLSQKLAILGPRRIVVELPEDQPGWRTFFERSGFTFDGWLDDLVADGGRGRQPMAAEPVSFADLEGAGVIAPGDPVAWRRASEALKRRADLLHGRAVVSDVRIEAFLLAVGAEEVSIERLGHAGSPEGEAALEALLRAFVATATGRVRIPRASSAEVSEAVAAAAGFHREDRWASLALEATPP